ncbi:MAG: hypothetical protein WCI18_02855 [Pseudomonadota bacterium]
MRFPTAWADIAAQNVTLKFVIGALSISLVTTATIVAKLALKDPLVIERGCISKSAKKVSVNVTDVEIKGFVEEVLPQRFGTGIDAKSAYLSLPQLKARAIEMEDLRKKGMGQKLVVNSVTIKGDAIRVDADRLVSIDKIRSAFPIILEVLVSRTTRTEDNPYGLLLSKVDNVDRKEIGK